MNRDAEGKLLPVVADDEDKMIDVNEYLNARDPEPKVKAEVKKEKK